MDELYIGALDCRKLVMRFSYELTEAGYIYSFDISLELDYLLVILLHSSPPPLTYFRIGNAYKVFQISWANTVISYNHIRIMK